MLNEMLKENYNFKGEISAPIGVTPIACVPQAHVAVVLCKHNPTDRKYVFINLSPFIIPYKRVTPLKPL